MTPRDIYDGGFDEDDGRSLPNTDCPECEGQLRTDGGETACTHCGLIVEEYRFDHEDIPRELSDTLGRSRTGAPLCEHRHDRGLSSEIGFGTDGKGNTLPGRTRRRLGRLRREHSRARWRSKVERNLAHGLTEIARIRSARSLPRSIRDAACRHFRKAQEADLLRGRSVEAFAAASVYAACREHERTETIADVATVACATESGIKNAYGVLNREFGLAVMPRDPAAFVPRLVSDLSLSRAVERSARELAHEATVQGIAIGCQPLGVAAGCLAIVLADREIAVRQVDLANSAGVSTATVRARRDQLQTELGQADRRETTRR
ncbi:transcription initiation factor IIB [Halapricum hydrolyticum]|uniref:Transcription initiation factor IIB n=1 Tax=Halapricum hydrolyticum TaxID=2979991 RepID=A0AAE3I9L0_9EURY|nr:transcription initiation factor IIB family protein [Halapricum hydrolyticum]MCU4726400.1 transcription initiation factor IIB family protein [Halapricum hydrolyticum]